MKKAERETADVIYCSLKLEIRKTMKLPKCEIHTSQFLKDHPLPKEFISETG